MIQPLIKTAEQSSLQQEIADFEIGDTVTVHVRIIEGNKQRIQPYTGVVIARRGRGVNENIIVRRIVNNEGVERILPLHSPKISKIEVVRSGRVRRAKLFYLRERVGKARRVKDQKRSSKADQSSSSAQSPRPVGAGA